MSTTTIEHKYHGADTRLIFLDYDGTLVPFHKDPEMALPDPALQKLIAQLFTDTRNTVVIVSGRTMENLETWFGHLPLGIIAEHGAWAKVAGEEWKQIPDLQRGWKPLLANRLEAYSQLAPGAFTEHKSCSLTWHYRKAEGDTGDKIAARVMNELASLATLYKLHLLKGNKVIEIKSNLIDKGKSIRRWLNKTPGTFILAAGDDNTDEDMFKAMPKHAVTIKVGCSPSVASHRLDDYLAVRALLSRLVMEVSGDLCSL